MKIELNGRKLANFELTILGIDYLRKTFFYEKKITKELDLCPFDARTTARTLNFSSTMLTFMIPQ